MSVCMHAHVSVCVCVRACVRACVRTAGLAVRMASTKSSTEAVIAFLDPAGLNEIEIVFGSTYIVMTKRVMVYIYEASCLTVPMRASMLSFAC